jgi:hypothetical protein
MIHHLAPKENLKVAKHMANQEPKQDRARKRHDDFLADCGIVKPCNRNRTHKLPLSPLCKRNIVSKKETAQSGLIETANEIPKRRKCRAAPRRADFSYKMKFN